MHIRAYIHADRQTDRQTYITQHNTTQCNAHSFPFHCITAHYIILHYITYIALHVHVHVHLHCITLHYICAITYWELDSLFPMFLLFVRFFLADIMKFADETCHRGFKKVPKRWSRCRAPLRQTVWCRHGPTKRGVLSITILNWIRSPTLIVYHSILIYRYRYHVYVLYVHYMWCMYIYIYTYKVPNILKEHVCTTFVRLEGLTTWPTRNLSVILRSFSIWWVARWVRPNW